MTNEQHNIDKLIAELSEALHNAYGDTGNNYYYKASQAMGSVQAQVWMAHNLSYNSNKDVNHD